MLKKILYCIEKIFLVVLDLAAGIGFFAVIGAIVFSVWGERYITETANLVFFLGGNFLSVGLIKLIEWLRYVREDAEDRETLEEMRRDEAARKLLEHLGVK